MLEENLGIYNVPKDNFKSHLTNPENKQILFSGKYGSGKTSFLRWFFDKDQQSKNDLAYDVYHLFPVNYSISSNEDILQYLKYDIIGLLLLDGKTKLPDKTKTYLNTLPTFLKRNLHKIAAAMVFMFPEVGKDTVAAFEKWDKLKEEFLSFHDESVKTETDRLIDWQESVQKKVGSLYENDIITRIISDMVKPVEGRESVLIIDDLDRLDPDHIFRILNVFGAHFDQTKSYSNTRLDFDKIILVCDIKNIESIFKHRYGSDADFTGYTDKFYSSEIFWFDNNSAVNSLFATTFKHLLTISHLQGGDDQKRAFFFRNGFIQTFLNFSLVNKFAKIRDFYKISNLQAIDLEYVLEIDDRKNYPVYDFPIAIQLNILSKFLGGYSSLRKILFECKQRRLKLNLDFLGIFFSFHSLEYKESRRERSYQSEFNNIKYFVVESGEGGYAVVYSYNGGIDPSQYSIDDRAVISTSDSWDLFLEVVDKLNGYGYLK